MSRCCAIRIDYLSWRAFVPRKGECKLAGSGLLGKGHLSVLRSLAEKGCRGTLLNSDNVIFQKPRRAPRDVVGWLSLLFDHALIERVPKTREGWFRITAAGRKRLDRKG